MFKIEIPYQERFDEITGIFTEVNPKVLYLEHSLFALRTWESKHHIPFLSNEDRTYDEFMDYICCMNLSDEEITLETCRGLTFDNIQTITKRIEDPMTASWINDRSPNRKARSSREVVTAELIYYWMFQLSIPIECEKWHLNQLMMLIQVSSAKNAPESKMTKEQTAQWMRQQNAIRRAKYNTRG